MYKILKNRKILPKIIKQLNNDLVLILIGPRQAGKTYILKLLKKYLAKHQPNNKILYFDLEKPDILNNFLNYQSMLNFLFAHGVDKNKTNFILLDEFQKMPSATKTLKIIHDHYPFLKIIATSSSSLEIRRNLRKESMVGRKRIFTIWPLNFLEFLNFTAPEEKEIFLQLLNNEINPAPFKQFIDLAEKMAIWGSYPKISLLPDKEEKLNELTEIYYSYLNKDIAGLLNEKDAVFINKIIPLLAAQTGSLFNLNEISKMADISRHKLEKYLLILKNIFVLGQIPPFYTNKQKEIVKTPKIYFFDTGLRNRAIKNFNELIIRTDNGFLMENFVFLELLKNKSSMNEIYFWRTARGMEVDFVISAEENKLIPVEVKYKPFDRPILPSGIKHFINAYGSKQAFVLTKNFYSSTAYNNCQINFLPVFLTAKIFKMI